MFIVHLHDISLFLKEFPCQQRCCVFVCCHFISNIYVILYDFCFTFIVFALQNKVIGAVQTAELTQVNPGFVSR